MANFVLDKGYRATGTAEYKIGQLVKFHATIDNAIAPVTAAGDKVIGVITEYLSAEAVTYGKAVASVRHLGIAHVLLAANVTLGANVATNATGGGIVRSGAGQVVGIAVENGTSGTLCNVLLTPLAATSA